mmetsp:Transcript_32954/g.84198  ORF Transcript_32954/g.84198 Transcript_32954/m.84198 type:complete len:339 (+) Transcript_32954:872-1888(+)
MGRGMPPGPPRVSAAMKRWKSALCRVVATSSAQYLKSTGRCCSAAAAVRSVSSTSGASSDASARHCPCTQRHSRSYAPSWCPPIASMISSPARWWCVCSSARQLAWMARTRDSAAKKSGPMSPPSSAATSSGASWYEPKNSCTRPLRRWLAPRLAASAPVSPSSPAVEALDASSPASMPSHAAPSASSSACTPASASTTAAAPARNSWWMASPRRSTVARSPRRADALFSGCTSASVPKEASSSGESTLVSRIFLTLRARPGASVGAAILLSALDRTQQRPPPVPRTRPSRALPLFGPAESEQIAAGDRLVRRRPPRERRTTCLTTGPSPAAGKEPEG